MAAKRSVGVTASSMYLSEALPVHVNRVSESFRLELHRHEFYEICYVGEGKGFHYIEGETLPVAKGDLFYLPVGASHVFRPSTPDPDAGRLIVYNCLFEESFASRLIDAAGGDPVIRAMLENPYPEQPWLRIRDRDGALQRSFAVMYEEFRLRRPHFVPVVLAETLRLLVELARGREEAAAPAGNSEGVPRMRDTDAAVDEVASLLRRAPAEAHSAERYAERCGMSERHFRRRFKERYGMTFLEYVHQCRIQYSCELLAATTDKVAAIALQAGYKDIAFFNRLFKKTTGTTPGAYRSAGAGRANGGGAP
ncbi:AraC family transcriptional regulator [Paenibacillus sp.]|uniref:AraC family transcriptional regulator n=1 Tax=Paenibacillus sp. TaxID=58172 RepID=UPI002D62CC16|nr:AraC family transcriptional regulator [Paenibacillus sp.]HZG83744.1 AraC family transcriptional regulator [Paenibacillus sp.]